MAEPMSAERLAEIRERVAYSTERSLDATINLLVGADVPDLLAEVDRLRAELTNIGIYHRKHDCDGNIPEDCGCADARREADGGDVCGHCQWPWPCLTLNLVNRALGGTK